LPDQVDPRVARERAAELRQVGEELAKRHRAQRVGGVADVIVVRGDRREGLTEDYLEVDLAGSRLPRGSRVTARLTDGNERLLAIPAQTRSDSDRRAPELAEHS
jgi:tRNA A37 methylthiotransferase MiaB